MQLGATLGHGAQLACGAAGGGSGVRETRQEGWRVVTGPRTREAPGRISLQLKLKTRLGQAAATAWRGLVVGPAQTQQDGVVPGLVRFCDRAPLNSDAGPSVLHEP